MASVKPIGLRIRMYQVGFGDCFLLTFEYAQPFEDGRSERHVLIDFGTTSTGGRLSPNQIATFIRDHAGGKIDVIVVTHRHRDHLSAFGDKGIVKLLVDPGYPKLVIRSWTEDPDLDRDARSAGGAGIRAARPVTGEAAPVAPRTQVGPKSRDFMRTLSSAETFTARLFEKIKASPPNSLGAEASGLAEDQLKNEDAVNQLRAWGDAGKPVYLHYGMRSGIESIVPGIRTRVLGPPTVDQHKEVMSQREDDPDEFWMIYNRLLGDLTRADLIGPSRGKRGQPASTDSAAHAGAPDDVSGVAPHAAATDAPDVVGAFGPVGPVRWLTDRMGRQQLNSLYRIVRILDGVLNNTSVILLFDVPTNGKPIRLLFGGDAQIENWEYALARSQNRALLRAVDVYKVGHHGSRNATPRTLFNLWQPRPKSNPRWALLSTKPGVHGKHAETAVPRETLVAALDTSMKLRATNLLADRVPYVELHADLREGKTFSEVPVPPLPVKGKKSPG